MTTLTTPALSRYAAEQISKKGTIFFDEMIFANIPNLQVGNLSQHLTMPAANRIVHRQAISQTGFINENAVVYSVTMGTEIGDFDFNFIGLVNRQLNLLAVAVYTNTIKKIKNKNTIQGNSLTRSILLEFNGAKAATNITIPAQTWQIDFTARLHSIDEKIRLTNRDLYDRAIFFEDGFKVSRISGNNYRITSGVAYIEGLRAELAEDKQINVPNRPAALFVDVVHHSTVTGAYQTEVKILTSEKADYVDGAGRQHYVQRIADISSNGTITDRRILSKLKGITPKKITSTTTNAVDTEGHTHDIAKASLTEAGIVQLNNTLTSTSQTQALTAAQGKVLKEELDALTIGGRNYLLNSSFAQNMTAWREWKDGGNCSRTFETVSGKNYLRLKSEDNGLFRGVHQPNVSFKPNTEYVFSITAFSNRANAKLSVGLHQVPGNNPQIWNNNITLTDTPTRYWFKFRSANDPTKTSFNLMIGGEKRQPFDIYIAEAKLEVGNRSTDWSPAPEDSLFAAFNFTREGFVAKAGDTMSGSLIINHPAALIRFQQAGNHIGYLGFPRENAEFLRFSSNKFDNYLELQGDKTYSQQPLYVKNNEVFHQGNLLPVKQVNLRATLPNSSVAYQDATPEQLPLGSLVGLSTKATLDGSTRNGWAMINKNWNDGSRAYSINRIGIYGNRLYLQSALDYQRWGEVAEVVTDKNDILIKGTKTFDYQLRIKSAEPNSEKCARLGQNVYDTFLQNPYSLKYLQLKNDGKLQYDNKNVFVKGLQNPSWEDIENNPLTIAQPDRTVDVRSLTKDGIYAFNNASPNLPSAYAYKVLNLAGGVSSWRHQLAFKAYSKEIYITSQKSSGSEEWLPWERLALASEFNHIEPAGLVAYFARSSAPEGWLKANGAAVSRTTYAKLFAAIGTTFGAGDGRTTFNLPDLRGEFLRGWDDGRQVDNSRALGSAQGDAIREIEGKINMARRGDSAKENFSGVFRYGSKFNAGIGRGGRDDWGSEIDFAASRVVPTANENRPRNVALLACIKY